MDLNHFQKKIRDAIRKEKEENGNDVRGYKLVYADISALREFRLEYDHDQKTVIVRD